MIQIPVTGGPSWADIMTAFGTVGAVIAAVGIALWGEWRSSRRLREERAQSRAQIEEERRIAREREQLTEAYAVQVINARASAKAADGHGNPDDPLTRPAAIVVNHGRYAITAVDARFSNGESAHGLVETRHLSAFTRLPKDLQGIPKELHGSDDEFMPWPDNFDVASLAPQDPGLQLIGPALRISRSLFVYALVRWTDRWGTRWEHKRGEVRQVRDDEPWSP